MVTSRSTFLDWISPHSEAVVRAAHPPAVTEKEILILLHLAFQERPFSGQSSKQIATYRTGVTQFFFLHDKMTGMITYLLDFIHLKVLLTQTEKNISPCCILLLKRPYSSDQCKRWESHSATQKCGQSVRRKMWQELFRVFLHFRFKSQFVKKVCGRCRHEPFRMSQAATVVYTCETFSTLFFNVFFKACFHSIWVRGDKK